MKRNKDWWARLESHERSLLVQLERANKKFGVRGGCIPDDMSECTYCGQPHMSYGICISCESDLDKIINKANAETV